MAVACIGQALDDGDSLVGLASVPPPCCLPGCGIFRILGYALTNVMTHIERLFCLFSTALKYFLLRPLSYFLCNSFSIFGI